MRLLSSRFPSPASSAYEPGQRASTAGVMLANRQMNQAKAEIAIVTVTAPPMRVAICAKGINSIRLAAVKIATSPVPPWPLWQAFTIADSMG
jgi:hypothetical protein